MKKWISRLFIGASVLLLALLSSGGIRAPVRAGVLIPRFYFPVLTRYEATRLDDFADQDPVWQYKLSEPGDGSFFHRDGRYVSVITDNSANSIAYPGWRTLGDFKLSVDARFMTKEWMNGLGLVFSGNDDWTEYYAYLLAYNFKQHFWTLARVEPPEDYVKLDGPHGSPNFVQWYARWNTLMVVRVGDTIQIFCNGLPLGDDFYVDGHYGPGRQVGILATSFEWSSGEVEYDNFYVHPIVQP